MEKRRLLQFHLSTAMVVMIVAAWILWMNVNEREYNPWSKVNTVARGWPIAYVVDWQYLPPRSSGIVWSFLLVDVATALLILGSVATVCELIIRRKIHLVTGLLVMISAVLFVWANMVERSMYYPESSFRGWPFSRHVWHSRFGGTWYLKYSSTYLGLLANCAIGILIIGAVAVVTEWFMRRKQRCRVSGNKHEP